MAFGIGGIVLTPHLIRFYRGLPIIRDLNRILWDLHLIRKDLAPFIENPFLARASLEAFRHTLLNEERYRNSKRLNRFETNVFSSDGADGIIAEIFQRIGVGSRTFLEIGSNTGLISNTAYLLWQGWSGCWIEGNEEWARTSEQHFHKPIGEGRLKVLHSFVTAENIRTVLQQWNPPAELDLLSLDIDRNTYYLWEAMPDLHPRVVVIEYNGLIPPGVDWKVEYHAGRSWNGTSYFGASLKAYELLGRKYGYSLVGCDMTGLNAYFIRQDLCDDKFEKPFTSEHHYEPPRYGIMLKSMLPSCFNDDPHEAIHEK